MGKGLRNTTIGLNFNINGRPLEDANRLIDEAISASRRLDRQAVVAGKQVERTGRQYNESSQQVQRNSDSLKANASASNKAGDQQQTLSRNLQSSTNFLNHNRQALDKATRSAKSFADKTSELGDKVAEFGSKSTIGITTPILAAGAAAIHYASDTNESLNKVEVAFGKSAKGVINWSKTTLNNIGLAQGTALDLAATFGDMSTSMGLSEKKASNMSTSLVNLAGDLASFKNIDIERAYTALNGVFTGETESLKTLGVVMTQANLQQFALSRGLKEKVKDMSQAEQVELRYQFVMAKTKNAQGDYARTASGTANSMRTFTESTKELASTMGKDLLPAITPVIQKATDLVQAFGQLDPGQQHNIIKWAAITAGVFPAILAFGKITSAIGSITKAISIAKGKMPGFRKEMALTGAQAVTTGAEMQTASTMMDNGPSNETRMSRKKPVKKRLFSSLGKGTRLAKSTGGGLQKAASVGSKFAKGAGIVGVGLSAVGLLGMNKDNAGKKVGGFAGSTGGMAIGAAIGTAIAPGLGTAIGGAVGSWAGAKFGPAIGEKIQEDWPKIANNFKVFALKHPLFSKAIADPFSDLISGGKAAAKAMEKAFEDPIPSMEKFGTGVFKSTAKAVNGYLKLNDKASEQLDELAWSGKEFSKKTYNDITSTFSKMGQKIIATDKKNFNKDSNIIKSSISASGEFTKKEQEAILKSIKSGHAKNQKATREDQSKIQSILKDGAKKQKTITESAEKYITDVKKRAAREHRTLTGDEKNLILAIKKKEQRDLSKVAQKERDDISWYQADMKARAVNTMSKSAREQRSIFSRLEADSSRISARQAANIVKHAKKAHDGAVKEANKKYDSVVQAADREYYDTGSITKKQHDEIIAKAKETRDAAVAQANDMQANVVSAAKKQAEGHVGEVNWETGEVLGKWDRFKVGLSKAVNFVSSGINKVLKFFNIPQIPMWEPSAKYAGNTKASHYTPPESAYNKKMERLFAHSMGSASHPGGRSLFGEEGPELGYMPHSGTATLLGANGPEIADLPKGMTILPASQTKDVLNGGLGAGKVLPGYSGGIGNMLQSGYHKVKKIGRSVIGFAEEAFDWALHPVKKAKELFGNHMDVGVKIGGGKGLGAGIMERYRDKATNWLKDNLLPFSGGGASEGKAAPAQVKKWILSAMAATGAPASWLGPLSTIAMHESGGNPKSFNNWDINAKRGIASRGLMQTIPPTFNAYKEAGMGDIMNPVHNAAAAINYIKSRYGSVFNVPGIKSLASGSGYRGYKNGGEPPVGEDVLVGEDGPELFKARTPGQIQNAQKTRDILSEQKGKTILNINAPVSITIQGNADENIVRKAVDKAFEEIFGKWSRALGMEAP